MSYIDFDLFDGDVFVTVSWRKRDEADKKRNLLSLNTKQAGHQASGWAITPL